MPRAPHQAPHLLDLRSIGYIFERLAWGFLNQDGLQWSTALRIRVSRADAPAPINGVFDIVIKPSSELRDLTPAVNATANATMTFSETRVHVLADTEVTVDTSFAGGEIMRRTMFFLFYEVISRLCENDSASACPRSENIGIARIVSPDGKAQMQVTVLQPAPPRRVLTMYQLGRALFYLLATYANSGRWEGSMSRIRLEGGLRATVTIEKLTLGLDAARIGGGDIETAAA